MTTNNPTDTNQASELHELCKEVYENTNWGYTEKSIDFASQEVMKSAFNKGLEHEKGIVYPLYTSDYLLEKLPVCVVEKYQQVDNKWAYSAKSYSYEKRMRLTEYEETPLKALLKLTIALSEAGELK